MTLAYLLSGFEKHWRFISKDMPTTQSYNSVPIYYHGSYYLILGTILEFIL